MKILMINKFLYPNGGSETYVLKLGDYLIRQGHEVQYFGMQHKDMCVGNRMEAYTSNMDFHNASKLDKLTYPFKTIYSVEARVQIRKILDDFNPDVCHLNNFNYQITPSIILEIKEWNPKCKIVYTAHDYNLICPNHMMNNPITHKNCEKCLGGNYFNCIKNKCIHGSLPKSIIGAAEAYFWNFNKVYKHIDKIICCSYFMRDKIESNSIFKDKTIVLHNFVDEVEYKKVEKQDYVLYFGRYSEEKGIKTLTEVCSELGDINFIFAGKGPLEDQIERVPNIKNVGFKKGQELEKIIREAKFSIYPSEWYENCPFSVMESQMYGTPVLAANIGGIPELIDIGKTGELFESGNKQNLKNKIVELYHSDMNKYIDNCKKIKFINIKDYCTKLLEIYGE